MIADGRQRAQQDVEALARFEAAGAEQDALVQARCRAAAADRRPRAGSVERVDRRADRARSGIVRIRVARECRDGAARPARATRSVAITASAARGAGEHRLPQRQIRGALERRARRIGRAELLEPLRVQHQRRRRPLPRRAGARVAEHARAKAVDDVGLPCAHEIQRPPAGAQAEQRIRRAAIEHRRPAPSGAGEREVRHELRADRPGGSTRGDRAWPAGGGCVISVTSTSRSASARDEIVDVALEAAVAVQREDRARDDGTRRLSSRAPSSSVVEPLDARHDRRRVESRSIFAARRRRAARAGPASWRSRRTSSASPSATSTAGR